MTYRYDTDARWMHDHWTGLADDDELTISAGGLRQWMAECLARSLGQPIAVEQHHEPAEECAEEPAYEVEDHQDEAGPTLHEGNQPETAAPDEEPFTFDLNRWLEALHSESASQPDDTSDGGEEG